VCNNRHRLFRSGSTCLQSTAMYPRTIDPAFRRLILRITLAIFTATGVPLSAQDELFDNPGDRERLASLRGSWRFSIGDDPAWARPDFDDSSWTRIRVPESWEDEGYRDYNGYAWYRRDFTLSANDIEGRRVFLSLGRIDDADEVYVNGELVGSSGQFPPDYATAYGAERVYSVPGRCLRPGQANVIAVRVYDGAGRGGIYDGRVGVFSTTYPRLVVELDGVWKFHPGDEPACADPAYAEADLADVSVPGFWENAGFPQLDGFAWYRRHFTLTEQPATASMVLLLGRIDDLDEVYLNGERIGGTGDLADVHNNRGVAYHRQNRGYLFSTSLLRGDNVIAVRVYDGQGPGGIYTGPLGLMTQQDYIEFWERRRRDQGSIWTWLRKLD
jgi:sialate O-acetylesterase